jgi:hypothetical protein
MNTLPFVHPILEAVGVYREASEFASQPVTLSTFQSEIAKAKRPKNHWSGLSSSASPVALSAAARADYLSKLSENCPATR